MVDVARSARENDGSSAGFSLIELCITIMLLGIILSIGVVSYANTREGINLHAAEKQVEAAITRAKLSARQENVEYHITFYPYSEGSNANTYEFQCYMHDEINDVWELKPTDNSVSGEKVTSSGGHYYVEVGNSVEITSGGTIVFKPAGTEQIITFMPSDGSEQTIGLRCGSRGGSVTVDAQGKITID